MRGRSRAAYLPSIILLGSPFSQPLEEFQGRSASFGESTVEQPAKASTVKPSNKRNTGREQSRSVFIGVKGRRE